MNKTSNKIPASASTSASTSTSASIMQRSTPEEHSRGPSIDVGIESTAAKPRGPPPNCLPDPRLLPTGTPFLGAKPVTADTLSANDVDNPFDSITHGHQTVPTSTQPLPHWQTRKDYGRGGEGWNSSNAWNAGTWRDASDAWEDPQWSWSWSSWNLWSSTQSQWHSSTDWQSQSHSSSTSASQVPEWCHANRTNCTSWRKVLHDMGCDQASISAWRELHQTPNGQVFAKFHLLSLLRKYGTAGWPWKPSAYLQTNCERDLKWVQSHHRAA